MTADPAFITRTVRLSRERWELLVDRAPFVEMDTDGGQYYVIKKPIEISGIIFLPATYVLGDK